MSLEHALNQMRFNNLKKGLGDEICDIVEFIKADLTKPDLIRAAVKGYGKEILDRKILRRSMLTCLEPERISELASKLNINAATLEDMIIAIGEKPFKRDKPTLLILQTLGLTEDELPDPILEKPADRVLINPPEEKFHELLDYQNDIRLKVLRYFEEMPSGRALIHIPTGAGKTKTAMHILKDFWYTQQREKSYILWLAHSQELLEQAISTFQSVWEILGRDEITYIRFWGKYTAPKSFNKNAFVFATVQKLIALKNNQKGTAFLNDFRSRVAMIVIDEAHRAPAQETYRLLKYLLETQNAESRYLLGLTATPGRSIDEENNRLVNLFEDTRFSTDLKLLEKYMPQRDRDLSFTSVIQYLQHRGILAEFKKREIEIPSHELGLDLDEQRRIKNLLRRKADKEVPSDLLGKLVKSRMRNHQIIQALRKAHSEEELTILVFACNVIHAKMLSFAMILEDIPNGLILGSTDTGRRNKLIKKYKDKNDPLRILISVDVLTTGFDAPNTDCLVIARPVHSVILYSQILGRGLRGKSMGGSGNCVLIQVVDKIDLGDEKWAFEYFDEYWS